MSGALIKTGVCETFMDIKELTDLLVKSGETVHCKYVPWWEDDFENCTYRYDILKEEEINAPAEALPSLNCCGSKPA